jgi:hypothetical protein
MRNPTHFILPILLVYEDFVGLHVRAHVVTKQENELPGQSNLGPDFISPFYAPLRSDVSYEGIPPVKRSIKSSSGYGLAMVASDVSPCTTKTISQFVRALTFPSFTAIQCQLVDKGTGGRSNV